jgi:hypothetical protein
MQNGLDTMLKLYIAYGSRSLALPCPNTHNIAKKWSALL